MIFKILHVISLQFGLICVKFVVMLYLKGDDSDCVVFSYLKTRASVEKFNRDRNSPGSLKV